MIQFEFYDRASAKAARDVAREWTHGEDDARLTCLRVMESIPEDVGHLLAMREWHAEPEERYGQIALSANERARIDFRSGRANTFHARSAKAIAAGMSVDDWIAHYDTKLTVDEHRGVYDDARADSSGPGGGTMEHQQKEYNLGRGERSEA